MSPAGTRNEAQPVVAVLLSTYNGARFLRQQLDSLAAQDFTDLHVHVRDDGSVDETMAILTAYAQRDRRFRVTAGHNIGCAPSFVELLRQVDADIYCFCDQDDVWLPGKVSSAVQALVAAGLDQPTLYHTDLRVVDESLRTISPSFMSQQGVRLPQGHDLAVMTLQNCVAGCTMAVTRRLVDRSGLRERVPADMAMHDWWLALCALCFGRVIYSADTPILYRQHASNVSGARTRSLLDRLRLQFSRAGVERVNRYRTRIACQAREFLALHGPEMTDEQRRIFRLAASVHPEAGFWPMVRSQRQGVRFQNRYMNAAFLYSALAT